MEPNNSLQLLSRKRLERYTTALQVQLSEVEAQLAELKTDPESAEPQTDGRDLEIIQLSFTVQRLVKAINWACGCGDSDFTPPKDADKRRYWWRNSLVDAAGLEYDREKERYVPIPNAVDPFEWFDQHACMIYWVTEGNKPVRRLTYVDNGKRHVVQAPTLGQAIAGAMKQQAEGQS